MKLIVLGSGTAVPSVLRSAPAYYLEIANRELLIDCGGGALVQLERANRSFKSIDAVFLTHIHQDHVGDLARLLHAIKATPGFERKKPLLFSGPPGFMDFFERAIDSQVPRPKGFAIEISEVEEAFGIFDVRIATSRTVHSRRIPSVAYRFEHQGKSIAFSGDCDFCPQVAQLSRQADLLVLDCSFPDAQKRIGHLSGSECGRIASEAQVKRVVLSHLYPPVGWTDTRLKECKALFDGDAMLAEDLMELEV